MPPNTCDSNVGGRNPYFAEAVFVTVVVVVVVVVLVLVVVNSFSTSSSSCCSCCSSCCPIAAVPLDRALVSAYTLSTVTNNHAAS